MDGGPAATDDRRLIGAGQLPPGATGPIDQRRISPPNRLVRFGVTSPSVAAPSIPNAVEANFSNRSAGSDRGAPRTTGTPSFTALR